LLRVALTLTSPVTGAVKSTVVGLDTAAPPRTETWKFEDCPHDDPPQATAVSQREIDSCRSA
jgi:hypothetical protein